MHSHSTTLYVVLDIGKNVHWLGAYAGFELQAVVEPLELRSDRAGFERVTAIIDGLLRCGLYQRVILGHEPTGVYHENWARAFMERYAAHLHGQATPTMDYRFVNPLLSKRERRDLERALKRAMNKDSDRLLVLSMDPRTEIRGLGRAELPPDPPWFYVG